MSKTLHSACFPALRKSCARTGLGHAFLFALLLAPAALHAQTIRSWEDEFLDRSKIQSVQNANIDTVQGLITLLPIPQTVTQGQNFRAVLSGIDNTFYEPTQIVDLLDKSLTVEDIDTVPGQPDAYLITDSQGRRIFTYNAESGRLISSSNIGGAAGLIDPKDSFPYLEGNNTLKVIVTDENQNRVFKINSTNAAIEWSFGGTGVLLRPSDAIVLRRSPEVLICDGGNNRIIAVDTTTGAINFEIGSGEFNNPVDVDFDPSSPPNVDIYLVTDELNDRVVLVNRATREITPIFGRRDQPGNTDSTLTEPSDADPLPNGNILIADAGNKRLIEVNRQGQIVWQFAREVTEIRDADRIRNGKHANKTIVALRDSATANNLTAKRLAYKNETFVLDLKDPGQTVDFDSLRFTGIIPPGTRIKLQLRTVQNPSDTTNTPWSGPTEADSFYTTALTSNDPIVVTAAINPIHDGDRYYQFRVRFETDDRLKTPELLALEVKATYFRAETAGLVVSTLVQDSADAIITAWRNLEFDTELPFFEGRVIGSVIVDILNAAGDSVLVPNINAQTTPTTPFDIGPERVPALRGRQSLRLRGTLRTTSAFASPKLFRWRVDWNSVKLGPSETSFVNASGSQVGIYRVNSAARDSAYMRVVDPNVLPLRDSVLVQVSSRLLGDTESIVLSIDRASRAFFRSRTGLRMVLANQVSRNNRLLEVQDRDTLVVSYVDPLDITDNSSATALVIQRTLPTIQIESASGVKRDTVEVGETVFVRVLGETDQDISPTTPDTILATIYDPRTSDSEDLTLVEVGNSGGTFRSTGILLEDEATQFRDGKLYVTTGSSVTARYQDSNLDEPAVLATAFITGPITIITLADKFLLQVAPNPYRVASGLPFKIRAQVQAGELTVRQVEIFNLAGEKVKTIPEGQIRFSGSNTIRSSQGAMVVLDWWDVRGEDSQPVATGTYFAKIHLTLTDLQGAANQVTDLKKLVILQQ